MIGVEEDVVFGTVFLGSVNRLRMRLIVENKNHFTLFIQETLRVKEDTKSYGSNTETELVIALCINRFDYASNGNTKSTSTLRCSPFHVAGSGVAILLHRVLHTARIHNGVQFTGNEREVVGEEDVIGSLKIAYHVTQAETTPTIQYFLATPLQCCPHSWISFVILLPELLSV